MLMEIDFFELAGLDYFFEPGQRIYWGYLILALIIALGVCRLTGQVQSEWLSKKIWLHPSALLDYRYFIVATLIKSTIIMVLLIGAGDITISVVYFLDNHFGYRPKLSRMSFEILFFYGLCLFIVNDFTRYWLHRMMHQIPLLWRIHQVHHSAEVLTPLTFYRVHPIENWLFGVRYALSAGLVTGLFIYAFGSGIHVPAIFGVNAIVLVAHVIGDNLRHSHFRLGYPAALERVFISPQQHQFHHTWNGNGKNFGGILALWDWCFGSLRLSNSADRFQFGLADEKPIRTITQLLVSPFDGFHLTTLVNRRCCQILVLTLLLFPAVVLAGSDLEVNLGRALFFDKNLSLKRTQSCASCHDPIKAFTDPKLNGVSGAASLGDDLHSLGDRNTPTLSYIGETPDFHFDKKMRKYSGGFFWDGRAQSLAQQATQPMSNPIEMAMPDHPAIIDRIKENAFYQSSLIELYGDSLFENTNRSITAISDALAAFQRTKLFSSFDSKYDQYLKGEYELTDIEDLGMSIFFSATNSNCNSCHQLQTLDSKRETFSNYEYHSIGVPSNSSLRRLNGVNIDHQDQGLGAVLPNSDDSQNGKFKVPVLRNVAITGPYMHNGVFKDLRTVILFYDKFNNPARKINPETGVNWKLAEIPDTVNLEELKAKILTDRKIDALVAFLKALTDKRYEPLLN
jgi:cytochrome c peroxidase/sterol desaturase/sphingolipid hydroxylase (fatty acid hydroxylase superfamily)